MMRAGPINRSGPHVGRRGRRPLHLAQLDHVFGGRTLLALHDFELNPIALGERAEALRLNGREVHEAVLLSVLGGDETKALLIVEPLHGAGDTRHCHSKRLLMSESGNAVPSDDRYSWNPSTTGRTTSQVPNKKRAVARCEALHVPTAQRVSLLAAQC